MKVLICRPAEDAKELIELIAMQKVEAFALPTIEIKDITMVVDLSKFTDFIFTSKHAVKSFFTQHDVKLFTDKNAYSIGAATAKELKSLGLDSQCPDKHNSQELFKLIKKSSFDDKKFAIISGVGGSTYVEDEISKHTEVTKVTTYERVLVDQKSLQYTYVNEYQDTQPDLIVATSIDVFKSLIRIFKETPLPAQTKITITSPKMLKFVLSSGFNHVIELKQIDNNYISKKILESI